jgi:hypothetical protein
MIRNSDDQNYIMHWAQLDESFLRKVFTGAELLLYKLVVIYDLQPSKKYSFEKEKALKRFRRLADRNILDSKLEPIFKEILHTRNAFAHSFLPIHEISYKDFPLEMCFGETINGGSYVDYDTFGDSKDGLFVSDARRITDHMIDRFCSRQLSQIDRNRLFRICDGLLTRRSLLP